MSIHWGNNPESYIRRAKERARAALKEENPKLTKLEKAFYDVFRERMEQ